jgi:hypothetical protein
LEHLYEGLWLNGTLNPAWIVTEIGAGTVQESQGKLILRTAGGHPGYSNAQISDYAYRRLNFQWTPPLKLMVTARFAGDLRGTAGFGFWNHPFSPELKRLPSLPRAIWYFFGAPPNAMQLAQGVPGSGWKAATIDATRPSAWTLAPFALPAVLLMRVPPLYATLWKVIQRRLRISEKLLDPALLTERHTYTLDWQADGAAFALDGTTIHETPFAPRGRCGFVAWIDNQYAIVTPQGRFGWGIVPVERDQTLILEDVVIEAGR